MALLTSSSAAVLNKSIKIDHGPVVIGRHPDCEVHVDDGSVSRRHAQITYEQPYYYLEDLNSRNGTMLNNQFTAGRTRLFDGSEIQICDIVFRFNRSSIAYDSARRPTAVADSGPSVSDSGGFALAESVTNDSHLVSQLDMPSNEKSANLHVSAEAKLQVLIKVTRALSELVDRDEVLERILEVLFELFVQADRGFVMFKDTNGVLQPLAYKCRRPSDDESIKLSSTIAEMVMDSQKALISRDAAIDDRFDTKESIIDFKIRSIMCAPLINSRDEAIGVIQLDTLRQAVAFRDEDLELFVTVASHASLAIQKSDLFADRQKTSDLKNDLSLAHELQQRFLPQKSPDVTDYDFFSWYRPMQQVGGDYFDYVKLDQERVAVIVADVVGHGITAALLMAKVSAEARFALATESDPVSAIQRINQSLASMNIDRFVTLVLALLNTKTHQVTIVNAGHMPPIIRRHAGPTLEQLSIDESGLPLGIVEDFEYQAIETTLAPGDVLLMYTDGINEAMDGDGNQLSTAGLIEDIRISQTQTPEAIGETVCESVSRHSGSTPAIDDMCLVCLGRHA